MRIVYLDHSATTPPVPGVREAMEPFLDTHFGHPAAPYGLGRAVFEAVEDARLRVARLLGATRDEIIFTSGGTEAANLAIWGVMFRFAPAATGHLIVSAVEHPAVAETARFLEDLGYELTVVGTDGQGRVDPDSVAAAIRSDTVLVSIQHANHEIGTIQPLAEIAAVCHAEGVLMHTDAAQSVGKIVTRVEALGVDLLSFSGHKMGGPKGIGALYVKRGIVLEPLVRGGGDEHGLRGGTPHVAGAVGLGYAAAAAEKRLPAMQQLAKLRDRLTRLLSEIIGPAISVNAGRVERLPGTLSVNFPDASGQDLLRRAPELCAATFGHWDENRLRLSPTQQAIGLPEELARGTIRFSLGAGTTEEDIDRAGNLLLAAWEELR